MGQNDFSARLNDALTKAFAATNPKVRSAYMDLADFYETQRRKIDGVSEPGRTIFR